MNVGVLARYDAVAPDGPYSYDSNNSLSTWESYPGKFIGNTFTGSYSRSDVSYGSTITKTGSIKATLNESGDRIESIDWMETHVSSGTRAFTHTYSFSGTDIALAWDNWGEPLKRQFRAEGAEACSHISSLTDTLESGADGLNYSISSYKCNWKSKIFVSFDTVEE